jgi:DNA-binding NarL/FixJ family response regulator
MRILIADDNEFVRRGIVGLLAKEKGIEVCGEAANSAEAINKVGDLMPDLVLLDISMPDASGLETALVLKEQFPRLRIIMMSQHDPGQTLAAAVAVGADGSVDKARLGIDLLPAIRSLY